MLPKLRQGRGLTQYDLATRLHAASGNASVTREEVSRWERGKRIPGPYWRTWLSRVLEVPTQELERAAASARRQRQERTRAVGGNPLSRFGPFSASRCRGQD
nr:hypothetical protein GCM10017745_59340 [Saccharothrix mutabilis subsp. capreolus]